MRRLLATLAFLMLFVSSTAFLQAQDRSSMTGVVTDVSGALLPDTAVVLSNPHTGVSFTQTTDNKGSYRFTSIPPGQGYVATFTHQGFASTQVKNLDLQVGTTRTQDATLQAGAAQTIEVSATGATETINTTDASIGNNISPQVLNELPVQVRDSPSALFTLQPGVTLSGSTTGARVDQDQVTVDGLDVNDMATGGAFNIVAAAPVDAMQEFKGTVSGFTTDSGPGGGGQFNLVTRSGTNHFHGVLFEYNRNAALVANSWFGNNSHIAKPNYIRNQFGGNLGGPILRGDKAFFFFDFYDSRIVQSALVNRTVPLDNFRAGNIGYVLNQTGCSRTSRQNTQPQCIGFYSPAQARTLDPAGIGENAAFFQLINTRYPHANNVAGGGDGVNTGLYTFTTPEPDNEQNYAVKLDYNLTSKHRLFAVGTLNRRDSTQSAPEFPQDGTIAPFHDRSFRWSVGDNWAITNNMANSLAVGETVSSYQFPITNLNPNGTNLLNFSGGVTSLMSRAWLSAINAQGRRIPIPQISDNLQWLKHSHSLSFGGFFKYINSADHTILDYNDASIGLGGQVTGLNANQRPSNILASSTVANNWDTAFAAALGRVASISQQFNYDASGKALPLATGDQRRYRYYQSEIYAGDTWKVTPSLTLSYGVNWQYFSVPYETKGLESVAEIVPASGAAVPFTFDSYFSTRVKQANTLSPSAVPLVQYVLSGKANHGPDLYAPEWHDFAPRFAFAYNPSWDRKSVLRGGLGMVYDRTIINAVQYQQDQHSYLFQQSRTENGDSLATDQRLGANATYVAPGPPPSPTLPFFPFVDDANGDQWGTPNQPYGLANGSAFNTMIDSHFKTPYSIIANFGVQHEFPAGFIMKLNYAGRFGRRLLGQTDANQVLDNTDPKSSQLLSVGMANATLAARACGGVPNCLATLQAQPWFENVAGPGLLNTFGPPTAYKTPSGQRIQNWTSFLSYELGTLVSNGDFADLVQAIGFYTTPQAYNAGMSPQFSQDTVYTNKGFSEYNGLLATVTKNMSHGLTFEMNYTFSHSIDNVSLIANAGAAGGYGFVCNPLLPRQCRGNSDFDTTQIFNGWFIYQLPFGHGRQWASSVPRWADEIIGGWNVSSIFNQHTGYAWSTVSNAFVPSYSNDAQAFFNGPNSDQYAHVNKSPSGTVSIFTKGNATSSEFSGPVGFAIGPRNNMRGPGYFVMDSGLDKIFEISRDHNINLKFRADFFNVLNHPSFSTPAAPGSSTDYTNSNFGVLTSTASVARIGQLALRVEF
ncbi:MAG TPA: carboxypeptidase-like regulatory domain-containing protein [Acidobacteriaceae bacterium]|nr:carboxypeptidase-like regulatory domain-containing protein [Acidobacteriaceae bacterium]